MSVDVDDLLARVETDLDNDTLQRILDAAVESVERSAGKAAVEVETHEAFCADFIVLSRRKTDITSITERRLFSSDAVTLSANDYREVGDYKIMRRSDGDNPVAGWGSEVVVTFTPEVDADVRDRVTLDLCQIDINYAVYSDEKTGNWSGKADWKKERAALFRQIREGRSPIA